jgi:hypothetical protein
MSERDDKAKIFAIRSVQFMMRNDFPISFFILLSVNKMPIPDESM